MSESDHSTPLLNAYYRQLAAHSFSPNKMQISVLEKLQPLYDCLSSPKRKKWLAKLLMGFNNTPPPSTNNGIYLWGNVGCGKTFLLDLFFEVVPMQQKQRLHFHQFMYEIHAQLNHTKAQENPLTTVARFWSKRIRLLYLDEFYVADIGDAMVLSELIKQLFAHGVVLIASSNCKPENLYLNGLQRQRFLPTIDLLNQHLEVIHLDTDCDYRLRFLSQKGLYITPLSAMAKTTLENTFAQLATGVTIRNKGIEISGRQVQSICKSGNIVWFDFNQICGFGRAAKDYLEIAQCYQTVIVSDIPIFSDNDDQARRFINMIDSFYDNNVIFVCSAAAKPNKLYRQGRLRGDFERTASRLIEMQSESYLTQGHLIHNNV